MTSETILIDTAKVKMPRSIQVFVSILKKKDPTIRIDDILLIAMELVETNKPSIVSRFNIELFGKRVAFAGSDAEREVPDWEENDRRNKEMDDYLIKTGEAIPEDFQ